MRKITMMTIPVLASLFAPLHSDAQYEPHLIAVTHDCGFTCAGLNCTNDVHANHESFQSGDVCGNTQTGEANPPQWPGYPENGTGQCELHFRDDVFARLACAPVGDGASCSISGNLRCNNPAGGTRLVGFSIGCARATGVPAAHADRDSASCYGDTRNVEVRCNDRGDIDTRYFL